MAHTIGIHRATAGFHEGKQGYALAENHVLHSNFVKRIADYNSQRLALPETIDEYQAEDWLLGRAVVDMLRRQSPAALSLPESTNGDRAGEPRYATHPYDGSQMRIG